LGFAGSTEYSDVLEFAGREEFVAGTRKFKRGILKK
jgi:hypothetical protein